MKFVKKITRAALLYLLIFSCLSGTSRAEEPLTVFAAASLVDVLSKLAEHWATQTKHQPPRLSFGASATMARQIQSGAPADLFISANPTWTEALLKSDHAHTAFPLISNRLVIIDTQGPKITSLQALLAKLKDRHLAIADPTLAPAGQYAVNFLEAAAILPALEPKLAIVPNVRQALKLAEIAAIPAIVYRSDALASKKVTTIFDIPTEQSGPIFYKAVLTSEQQLAAEFLEYLKSPHAAATWATYGFTKVASN